MRDEGQGERPGGLPLVLASGSPRRRELLQQLGLEFQVETSDLDEDAVEADDPHELARRLARLKVERVARRFPDAVVLAADTVVVLGDRVLGKPADAGEARRMLRELAGKTHSVITGVALCHARQDRLEVFSEETRVEMRSLTGDEIEAYVASGEPSDKAGGYGIQGRAGAFIPRIEGCYFNVVGLPLAAISRRLEEFGVVVWRKPAE